MAEYKVPQDVEAEDKLIGPFSFRQFIYLGIVVGAGAIGWFLSQAFILLGAVMIPVILFFGALALPLRKDQPMETYLAALIQFYTKPRVRKWDPDGVEALVEISVPKLVEEVRSKDISRIEAERRLGYLAQVVDSGGWSVRGGIGAANANSAMNTDAFFAAQQTQDVLDDNNTLSQNLTNMIEKSDERRRQETIERMRAPQPVTQNPVMPTTQPAQVANAYTSPVIDPNMHLEANPFPSDIHQTVIQPTDKGHQLPQHESAQQAPAAQVSAPAPTPVTTSGNTPSPATMDLANDVKIDTLAKLVNREPKKEDEGEVFVSLR